MGYKLSMYNIKAGKSENEGNYYFNTLSGAIVSLDKETEEYINKTPLDNYIEEQPWFEYLSNKGFIVPENLNEYERIQSYKDELLHSPHSQRASFVIALTTACNYQCTYCYEEGCEKIQMSSVTAQNVARFIEEKCSANLLLKEITVTWFGGEPLLNMEAIQTIGDELLKFCDSKGYGFSTNIITNGYLLSEKTLDDLLIYNLKSIQITFDGTKEFYDRYKKPVDAKAYDIVFDNVIRASHRCHVVIRLNCLKDNYSSVKDLCREFVGSDANIKNMSFSLARVIDANDPNCISNEEYSDYRRDFIEFLADLKLEFMVKKFLPSPHAIPCGLMQKTNYVIDSSGLLYKCEHFVGKPSFSIGNVVEGELYPSIKRKFIETPMYEKCSTCPIYPVCRGGCSQKRFAGESSVSCDNKMSEIMFALEMVIKSHG